MSLRHRLNLFLDAMSQTVHDVTDPVIRCSSTNNGERCVHDKGHSSSHEDAEGNTW